MATDSPPIHDMLKPLAWLLGKWTSLEGSAKGQFPTIKDFTYDEEIEFFHIGQPNIQFAFNSYQAGTRKPLHREVGFLRIKPGSNTVAFLCAQNVGVAEVEEGEVKGHELSLTSRTVGGMTFGKAPHTTKVARTFRLEGDVLEQVVQMETTTTPLTEHLRIKYKKAE